MRGTRLASLVILGAALASCRDARDGAPAARVLAPSMNAAVVATAPSADSIAREIGRLFIASRTQVGPYDQSVAQSLASTMFQYPSGDLKQAEAAFALVDLTLRGLAAGALADPNGSDAPTSAEAATQLVADIYAYIGKAPPTFSQDVFGPEGAIALIGPAGGFLQNAVKQAAIKVPAGAVSGPTLFTIEPTTNPLPTKLQVLAPRYELSTYPAGLTFAVPVNVGIAGDPSIPAQVAPAGATLRLAHPDPADVSQIQILPSVACPIAFSAVAAAPVRSTAPFYVAILRGLGDLFVPETAYALGTVTQCAGGATSSFSPFARVIVPGARIVAVCAKTYRIENDAATATTFTYTVDDKSDPGVVKETGTITVDASSSVTFKTAHKGTVRLYEGTTLVGSATNAGTKCSADDRESVHD